MPDDRESSEPELKIVRVYLRDFVLPVRIGVFSHEKTRAQDVRFDVTVDVDVPHGGPKHLDDILSYDRIREVVSATVAEGHVDLAEVLAETIARRVLRERRARRVSVQVEKLEIGPGRVGVEIIMTRPG